MQPKPVHLGDAYAAQFEDRSVARAYFARPPYPPEVFRLLSTLLTAVPRRVLELGAGSGDLTIALAPCVDSIEAVEPSRSMIELGRARSGHGHNIAWIEDRAESFTFEGPYAAVVAAESLHWMDWKVVFPKIVESLAPGGALVLVFGRSFVDLPWEPRLRGIVARYSTNQDYRAYDIVTELSDRGLFREGGRRRIVGPAFSQSLDDYVESFHSRNGFSRDRMGAQANQFGQEVRQLVRCHCVDDRVAARVATTVVWGTPLAAPRQA